MRGSNDFDDYEEEEIVERNEYEDGDDVYYDDDIEDEHYDEYDDQYYDEPYANQYPEQQYYSEDEQIEFDEKFNKVLDELAELRKTISESNAVSQAHVPAVIPQIALPAEKECKECKERDKRSMQPVIINPNPSNQQPFLMPFNQPNGPSQEVIMYNEISRLRDEISKTQGTQELQAEMGRLKDHMGLDSKINENSLVSEIRRLNEKIEHLTFDSRDSRTSQNYFHQLSTSTNNDSQRMDFQKLVDINESILRSMHDMDLRNQSQMFEVKNKLAALPDLDGLIRDVHGLKKDIEKMEVTRQESDLVREIESLKKKMQRQRPRI